MRNRRGNQEVAKKRLERKKPEDNRLRDYELVYILSPDIDDELLETRVNGISQFITGREGVVDSVDKWGKRRLAYPLKHFLEGNYVLARFKLSPARCRELEANLRISEEVLRHLLVKVGA
jgi:small subunit ribosomal protein S6